MTPLIPVSKARLYTDVQKLTAIDPPRNANNRRSLAHAAHYIGHELLQLDGTVEWQKFPMEGHEYQNVICTFGDVSRERLVVGAHYDVCGNQPGADDNASAVAGLLELARLVHQLRPKLRCGIEFVAFTLEEPPYFGTSAMGSAVHARSLAESDARVRAMICLEMIGYFSDAPGSQRFPIDSLKYAYPTVGNFITVVGRLRDARLVNRTQRRMKQVANVDVQAFVAPAGVPAIGLSDQRNYWAQGYPAVMINDTSFYRNPHYHARTDTIDTLDFDRMAEVVRGVYWALVNL